MAKVRPTTCPYCGSPAIFDSIKDVIICEPCDAIYTITKEGGAKVKKTGVFDDHEERIKALEQTGTAPGHAPEEPEELEEAETPEQPTDEEEIFER